MTYQYNKKVHFQTTLFLFKTTHLLQYTQIKSSFLRTQIIIKYLHRSSFFKFDHIVSNE